MDPRTVSHQARLFQHIKDKLPDHIALVDALADLLNISNDSAYRRIRGEKEMGFEELALVCGHYKISLDQFLDLDSETIVFSGNVNNGEIDPFSEYMNNLEASFSFFNSFEKKELFALVKDIPPFVHFHLPELAKFKFYFWSKSILHDKNMKNVKFQLADERYDKYLEQGRRILELFLNIPNTEIWNVDSINSTLRQINFYYETGAFLHDDDVVKLYDSVNLLLDHLELQAETGKKFMIGSKPGENATAFRLLNNELVLGDNTYLALLNGQKITFLNHSVVYFIHSSDKRFNDSMWSNLENLMHKSTQLNVVGEKERSKFFNRLRQKVAHYRGLVVG